MTEALVNEIMLARKENGDEIQSNPLNLNGYLFFCRPLIFHSIA